MKHAAHASPCMFSRLERDVNVVCLGSGSLARCKPREEAHTQHARRHVNIHAYILLLDEDFVLTRPGAVRREPNGRAVLRVCARYVE